MNHLALGIATFDNVFPESMDYIKRIQDENIQWRSAEVLVNEDENVSGTNYKARDTDLIVLPHHEDNAEGTLAEFTQKFHAAMKPCLDEYINFYYPRIQKFENPQLLRYGSEQKFHDHVDDHPFFTRRLSLTYYLNDDYEGGDVEFKRHNLRFKANKNQLLLFPSNFLYPHRVDMVTKGTRYSYVSWTW